MSVAGDKLFTSSSGEALVEVGGDGSEVAQLC